VREGEKQLIGRGRGYRYGLPNQEYYFKTGEEMKKLFTDLPEAIWNLKSWIKLKYTIWHGRFITQI
jgi:DNA polymerase-3 subunit alpha